MLYNSNVSSSMRNYIYLFLLLLLGSSSVTAQTPALTINGKTLYLGDSLAIGLPYMPGQRHETMEWSQRNLMIPAFTKGKLMRHITPPKTFFGDIIGDPDTIYFLSLPQFPKDSLIVHLSEAICKGEIITAPTEHETIYPEAIELSPADYVPALIKAGYMTYTDVAIKAYTQASGNIDSARALIDNPFGYQRQRTALLEKLKGAVERFQLDQIYYVRHKLFTKEYDFTRSAYPWDRLLGMHLPTLSTPGSEGITLTLSTEKVVPFISVSADRAESYEKRSQTLGLGSHTLYIKAYFRLLPSEHTIEEDGRIYQPRIDYLGLDLYEYPHCSYYHLGSAKAE